MLPPSVTHRSTSRSGPGTRRFLAVLIVSALSAVGCSSGSGAEPDISAEGQLSYACALFDEIAEEHGPVDSWTLAVGDEAGPELRAFASALGLTGAPVGLRERHGDLSVAAASGYRAFSMFDVEQMQTSLDELGSACDERGLPEGNPDVSEDGRVTYACALIEDLSEHHEPVVSWGDPVGDEADPAWISAVAAFSMFGGTLGADQHLGSLSEAGTRGVRGFTRLDVDEVQDAFDSIDSACRDRDSG